MTDRNIVLEREHKEFYDDLLAERRKHAETKEQLRRHDAWLGQAHVLCSDLSVKHGHIEDRLFEAIGAVTEQQNLLIKIYDAINEDDKGPGHSHDVPGIWDADNGELSGKPCEWCATWTRLREVIGKIATRP